MVLDAKYQGYICLVVSDMKSFSCFPYKICSLKGTLWKQRLHQRTETRVCIFPGPD